MKIDFVLCPYCNHRASLVTGAILYPFLPKLKDKFFWRCKPCDAYVGCHARDDGKEPLGSLANAELRELRKQVHSKLDKVWKSRKYRRDYAYRRLAMLMEISREDCHVAMFDVDQCKEALIVIDKKF